MLQGRTPPPPPPFCHGIQTRPNLPPPLWCSACVASCLGSCSLGSFVTPRVCGVVPTGGRLSSKQATEQKPHEVHVAITLDSLLSREKPTLSLWYSLRSGALAERCIDTRRLLPRVLGGRFCSGANRASASCPQKHRQSYTSRLIVAPTSSIRVTVVADSPGRGGGREQQPGTRATNAYTDICAPAHILR